MGFFVVGRTTDGLLEMLGSQEYGSREDAARGIQTLAMAGTIDVEGRDVYIVDMAGAAPVVIVGVAAPAPAPVESTEDQPAAGAWETTDEIDEDVEVVAEVADEVPDATAEVVDDDIDVAVEDELLVEDVFAETEVPSESDVALEDVAGALDDEATPSLADALKRAATSLEDEGIVAPESIGAAEIAEVDEAATTEEDLSDVIAALTVGSAVSESPTAVEAPVEETTEWPWANVGVVPVEAEAESDEVAAVEPADDDELLDEALEAAVSGDAGDDSLIVPSAAYGEDPFAPRAVIMGDYDDAPASVEEAQAVVSEEPEATDTELPEVASLPGAYEMSGDLELGSYTCEDCVYSNTCPKVGQSTPDECGAFQWKAV